MNRAERRHEAERMKAKAVRKIKATDGPLTKRAIGIHASAHGTCPCGMCTTPALKHSRPEPETRHRDMSERLDELSDHGDRGIRE